MSQRTENAATAIATEAALETIQLLERIKDLEAKVNALGADTFVNFQKLDNLRAEFDDNRQETAKRLTEFGKQIGHAQTEQNNTQQELGALSQSANDSTSGLAATYKLVMQTQSSVTGTQNSLNDPTTGLAATYTLATQTAGALTGTQNMVTAVCERLARLEAKVFHHEQGQQNYFNLQIPSFPNADGKTVKVAMFNTNPSQNPNQNPVVTFKVEQGGRLSIEGAPGQAATFQMLVNDKVVDTVVTLTILPPSSAIAQPVATTSSAARPAATAPAAVTAPSLVTA